MGGRLLTQCLCYVSLCAELEGLVEPTPAADWWSLGAILFEILTGQVMGLYFTLGYWLDQIILPSSHFLLDAGLLPSWWSPFASPPQNSHPALPRGTISAQTGETSNSW